MLRSVCPRGAATLKTLKWRASLPDTRKDPAAGLSAAATCTEEEEGEEEEEAFPLPFITSLKAPLALSYHPPASRACLRSSQADCVPYLSSAGALRSSMR